ncbi:MAG: hypothetical protein ACUZ9M_10690 [Candidatus Scalindua sp.]
MSAKLIIYHYERALGIIGYEVKDNLVDADLFDMFVKEKVYELLDKEG